ncbi:helix-turn-helix domain-containing protein [Mycoplasma nasistruthionis]|uniref:Chromosomal replication initiator protein DnaA n=1 Tax=Mycoplasma nasistruthionis TaxID=353852 RepID=A0A4Y6I6Z4_9MOLU|nr:DnaA/Hda family protein [Mycoplasma nasistruthionis]QDF65162.1 AAA family ATPase [Mycoplasma nasistruthionis]
MNNTPNKKPPTPEEVNLNVKENQLIQYFKSEIRDPFLFNTFFKKLKVLTIEDKNIVIFIKKPYPNLADFKKNNNEFFEKAVFDVLGRDYTYTLVDELTVQAQKETQKVVKSITVTKKINLSSIKKDLDKTKTFSNYINCHFNSEVYEIIQSIINNEYSHNVLFISGKSGHGKTHIISALENELVSKGKSVFVIKPIDFTNQVTSYMKDNRTDVIDRLTNSLVKEYDYLFFDDFHVFGEGNKKATKDLIFKILDDRIFEGKITIITSEKDLKEISKNFHDRIISRISSGFQTRLLEPNYNDYKKLLCAFLPSENLDENDFSEEAIKYIARSTTKSLNTLIGAIKRLGFYREKIKSSDKDVVLNVVKNILVDYVTEKEKAKPETILKEVAKYYKITTKDITGKSRKKEIVVARWAAVHMIKIYFKDISSVEIGKILQKDHATILNAFKKNEENKESLNIVVNELRSKIDFI